MKVQVLHNQSLFDVVLQHTGSVASVVDVAKVNNISVTDDLEPAMELVIPDTVKVDNDILNYYSAKAIQPATAITEPIKVTGEGIGYWAIGVDFIVSPDEEQEGIGYWAIGTDFIVS